MVAPAHHIFSIVELLDMISTHLKPADVFGRTQLVCKLWKAVVDKPSRELKQALYISPTRPNTRLHTVAATLEFYDKDYRLYHGPVAFDKLTLNEEAFLMSHVCFTDPITMVKTNHAIFDSGWVDHWDPDIGAGPFSHCVDFNHWFHPHDHPNGRWKEQLISQPPPGQDRCLGPAAAA